MSSKRMKIPGFEIPKPPAKMNQYALFTKEQCAEMTNETFQERTRICSERWKTMSQAQKQEYGARADREHQVRMSEWEARFPEREQVRQSHCRKLGVSLDTSWEKLYQLYAKREHGIQRDMLNDRLSKREQEPRPVRTAAVKRESREEAARRERMDRVLTSSRKHARSSSGSTEEQGKRRRVTGSDQQQQQGPWQGAWEPVPRKRAIVNGLDEVFRLAQDDSNFTLFGNDIIQCFYDVATVTGEPVRSRALKYVEQLAHRWKHSVMIGSWKVSERPTPYEVIDCIIGMYCMERVGIHHDLKPEVRSFLEQEPAMYSAVDYLGWDPTTGPPQAGLKELSSGEPVSIYRTMSNSLIHTFYAERVGLDLGCSYKDVFQHLPRFRPWCSPEDLPPSEYMDQCYLVTHVVFTLNNWGELMLDPELAPHEYCFARNHLTRQIARRDVHLVGEFIEVLRSFGVTDSDPLIQAGLTFLLRTQEEDGSWDGDKDPYTKYHATMVGIQALLAHSFRGYGPGITSVAPLMVKWARKDKEFGKAMMGDESAKYWGKGGGVAYSTSALIASKTEDQEAPSVATAGEGKPVTLFTAEGEVDARAGKLHRTVKSLLAGLHTGSPITEAPAPLPVPQTSPRPVTPGNGKPVKFDFSQTQQAAKAAATATTTAEPAPSASAQREIEAARVFLDKIQEARRSQDWDGLHSVLEDVQKMEISVRILQEIPIAKELKAVTKSVPDSRCSTKAKIIVKKWKGAVSQQQGGQ